jgi:hypothetical protein
MHATVTHHRPRWVILRDEEVFGRLVGGLMAACSIVGLACSAVLAFGG